MTLLRYRTDRSGTTGLPPVVYALGVGIFLLGTTEFMIAGLLPEMAADLDVSVSRAGLLIAGFAVGMALGAPAMAVLTLRLPRRTTLGAALAVFAAGHVLSATAQSFVVELVARFVTAVATGTFWAVAAVVVTTAAGEHARAKGLAVLIGGLTVANVAGVPLGTVVGQASGWRVTFVALAVIAVLIAAALLPMIPPREPTADRGPGVRREFAAFRQGRLWLALGTIALLQTAAFGTFSYVSPLLTDAAGLPSGAVPVVLAAFGVGAFVGTSIGGRFGDRHPWRLTFGGMAGVVLVLLLLATAGHVAALAVAAVTLLGVFAFSTAAPLTARVLTLAGPAPTLASASSTSAFNVGNTVGPWLGGIAIAHAGPTGPAALGIVAAAAAIGVAALSVRADRDPAQEESAPIRGECAKAACVSSA